MIDAMTLTLILITASLFALGMIAAVGLKAFTAWIDLKRTELDRKMPVGEVASASNRIELADLKERLRKLEAIAAGVDL
jgi:hypothetical protein